MSEAGDPGAATRTAFRVHGPDSDDWAPDAPASTHCSHGGVVAERKEAARLQ